ncbi:hypothetical protein B0H14DRAFT_1159008 [Mycena olivaceomarginata]|nr:hypothetical protein B0H14DRAFT_1159008 [Mycena olivaceomarginata]
MRSSTTGVAGAEEAYESHPARPVTIGMGTDAGAGMRLRPPGSGAGGGCGRENPFGTWNGWLGTLDPPRCGSPLLCDFSYSTPPSPLTPRCIFCVAPTSCQASPSTSAQYFIGCTTSTSSPLCFPSPVSRFLDAGSVIPVAAIPAARISIDLRLRSLPRAVPRQEFPSILSAGHSTSGRRRNGQRIARCSCPRGPGWLGHTRLFSRAYIGAGEADLHASGAGSGIGLHRIRRRRWEWEGRLVRRTSCHRLAGARG